MSDTRQCHLRGHRRVLGSGKLDVVDQVMNSSCRKVGHVIFYSHEHGEAFRLGGYRSLAGSKKRFDRNRVRKSTNDRWT